jgi:hypothetical protein
MELRASAGPKIAAKPWVAGLTHSAVARSVVPDAPDDSAGQAGRAA